MVFHGILWDGYPETVDIAKWKITIFKRYINSQWTMFNSYLKLLEGGQTDFITESDPYLCNGNISFSQQVQFLGTNTAENIMIISEMISQNQELDGISSN